MANHTASSACNTAENETAISSSKVLPVVLSGADVDALPTKFYDDQIHGTCSWSQIFNSPDTPTTELTLGLAKFPARRPDQESFLALHRHKQAEFYYMLKGKCIVKIEGVEHPCQPGHVLFIPGDAEHGVWNASTTEEVVFLWGFAAGGLHQVVYRFSDDRI